MRIKGEKKEIDYQNTELFFRHRAEKYKEENPYSVTMYQDNNPELVKARNAEETAVLVPQLKLTEESRILDVACGIGRWSDAITQEIDEYCGIDFCEELVELARKRNAGKSSRHFFVGKNTEIATVLQQNKKGMYNRVLLIGALMYLNDADVDTTLQQIVSVCEENALICIREPIGIDTRLTLKEQYSEELGEMYNAIYRTRNEFYQIFLSVLAPHGFQLVKEDYLFKDSALNNRKETIQYYFILERRK